MTIKKISFLAAAVILALGIFGAHTTKAQALPAGCTTTNGYSTTTGGACSGTTTYAAGCTTGAGFSATTGAACNNATLSSNGYAGSAGVNGYLNGCTSTNGFSTTNGLACTTAFNNVMIGSLLAPAGCFSASGYSTVSGQICNLYADIGNEEQTPGLPTTGAGGNAAQNIALMLLTGAIALFGLSYIRKNA